MLKKKLRLSPIMTFIVLSIVTILLSGIFYVLNVQAEYSTVNPVTNELTNNVVQVENLLSGSGLKYIVTSAVSGFVNFEPLPMLIIILIGIGILEKTGFIRTVFTLLTQKAKKNSLTFLLIFISLFFSIVGDLGFVVMLPLGALLFKYGRRNPLGGIIASFASMSFGYGINIFLSANDASLMTLTQNAARLLSPKYSVGVFFSVVIMSVILVAISIAFTYITEKRMMPKLGKYEFDEEDEEFRITNKELRGLIVGLGLGLLYVLLIVYMIIPGLPLSGGLLDSGGTRYLDMIFGSESLFAKGFIFIVTLLFIIVGLGYGVMTKTIKNNKDISESFAYSLDGIGNILVLLFFASLFLTIFTKSNIGFVITAAFSSVIANLEFTGIWLILIVFLIVMFCNFFCPSSLIKWNILSGVTVPLFMNASISPEFAQILFTASESVTNGITPLLTFFVVYIAFMEKYSKGSPISLFGSIKYMVPYGAVMFVITFVSLIGFYITGLPLGINSMPGVTYGA